MQRKTTSVALTLVILLTASAVQAQKSSPATDSRSVVNRMTKELGLTETQQSKVEAILNNEKKKVEAVFSEEKKQLQSIQEETRASLQAVLTPEQMDKLEKKMRQGNSEKNTQKK